MYKRTNSMVENYKQLAEEYPWMTPEYGMKTMLTVFTMHDTLLFEMLEEEFGTKRAVDLYAKLWAKRAVYEFNDLKEFFDVKPDEEIDMNKLIKMIQKYFNDFGNPFTIKVQNEDYIEGQVCDCPYTTEIVFNTYSDEKADHFNDSVQIACNVAIFEKFLELAGLDKQWLFGFPSQLCRGGTFCTFTYTKKQPKR